MNVNDGTTSSDDKSSRICSSCSCSSSSSSSCSSSSSSDDKHPAQSTVDYGPLPCDVPGKAIPPCYKVVYICIVIGYIYLLNHKIDYSHNYNYYHYFIIIVIIILT
jgi:hypothetical protein